MAKGSCGWVSDATMRNGRRSLRADMVVDRPLGREGHLLVEVHLVGADAEPRLRHRGHVVVPARPLVGPLPVRRPAVIGGVDVGGQPLLEAVQLVRPAEMHLARQDRAVAEAAQVMREGRDVGAELGGIVVAAGARRQRPRHEGRARGRAERAVAIGALEHRAARGEPLEVRRLDQRVAVDRQEPRRQLVDHDDEDIGLRAGHASRRERNAAEFIRRPPPRLDGSRSILIRRRPAADPSGFT